MKNQLKSSKICSNNEKSAQIMKNQLKYEKSAQIMKNQLKSRKIFFASTNLQKSA